MTNFGQLVPLKMSVLEHLVASPQMMIGAGDHIATNGGTSGKSAADHAGNDGAAAAGIALSVGAISSILICGLEGYGPLF